jgi:hypothetical protein
VSTSTPTASPPAGPGGEAKSEAEEAEATPPPAPPPPGLAPAPDGPPLADSGAVLLLRKELPEGGALERLVEPSGDIVVHLITAAGTVESCDKVGSLFRLPVVQQDFVAGGEVLQVSRDESGALVRWVVRADGEPRAVAVVPAAPVALR